MLPVYIGNTQLHPSGKDSGGEVVRLLGEDFYKISNYDAMQPFFMSLVSSSDHWLFIASTGGLSAGRVNADHALFPYYTVDKLTENSETTGAKTILLVEREGKTSLWEPFSVRQQGLYRVERHLYKNFTGTALVFEEGNHDLGLTYRYAWRTGDRFGFIKSGWLVNQAQAPCQVDLLDGLQNLLPPFVGEQTQNAFSPLLDAYKRSELRAACGLGLVTLNAAMTDLAEPSEALLASTCWQTGLQAGATLLSSQQLDAFRRGEHVTSEAEVRGQRGAYFAQSAFQLKAGEERAWHLVADVDQDAAQVIALENLLSQKKLELADLLEQDMAANTDALERIAASADGLQVSSHRLQAANHFANVLFNEMRGGYFPDQYGIDRDDFRAYVKDHNRSMAEEQAVFFTALPQHLPLRELKARAADSGSADLMRLAGCYLPLSFSRRHGDPSRPWNRFSINIRKKDGTRQLDYEGNWRDIFQNWEALAYSYPEYTESMIDTFLNATTADGYNPYRITRRGIDWEVPEPSNPWSNIGYWSDHQVIYLLKLMELSSRVHPGRLQSSLTRPHFTYADVPYRIKPYAEVLQDPYNTIAFDRDLEKRIEARVKVQGSDGKLVQAADGSLVTASLVEKLLTLLLAKLVNFVPEGGIWMNTQRPEWNDANNALVGKGLSVVTLAYLRRFLTFTIDLLREGGSGAAEVHAEVAEHFDRIARILEDRLPLLQTGFDDASRRVMLDALGEAGSAYRWNIYQQGFSGKLSSLAVADLADFCALVLRYVDHSLCANRRIDGLYHSCNILHLAPGSASISYLYEMLEGQVAVLSSGLLTGAESLQLLTSLRNGPLYRADQHSYILYPNRQLKGFVERNTPDPQQMERLDLVRALLRSGDSSLFVRDEAGGVHFAGAIHNVRDVRKALEGLTARPEYKKLVQQESARIEELFEQTFQHDQFTGRSGTFFAYEGLGSIYWHMVSKLVLAVEETIFRAEGEPAVNGLLERYTDIRAGSSFNKTPAQYGAFPTDPYSHTPAGQGAKQPGMTGMVKEEILARQAELGFTIVGGRIVFDFTLFNRDELLRSPSQFRYLDVNGDWQSLELRAGELAYTICQVPVVLRSGGQPGIRLQYVDGSTLQLAGLTLDEADSRHIFERYGVVQHLVVHVPE